MRLFQEDILLLVSISQRFSTVVKCFVLQSYMATQHIFDVTRFELKTEVTMRREDGKSVQA